MSQPLTDSEFDKLADAQLGKLYKSLMDFDPDEIEAELALGVLSITVLNQHKVVINSHRAARQIWMAAERNAWHFDPEPQGGGSSEIRWISKKSSDELRATLGGALARKTGREMLLWRGSCIVHETFSERKMIALTLRHPDAEVIAHRVGEPLGTLVLALAVTVAVPVPALSESPRPPSSPQPAHNTAAIAPR
mgnify:CR=1 FL=1